MVIRRKIRKLPGLTKKDKPRELSPMAKRALNVSRGISSIQTELDRDVRTREIVVSVSFRLDYYAVDDFKRLTEWTCGSIRLVNLRDVIRYLERLNTPEADVRIAMNRPTVI